MKTILALVALLGTVTLAAMQSPPSDRDNWIAVQAVSTDAARVTGGDVLVRVVLSPAAATTAVKVSVAGRDVTAAFKPGTAPNTLMGVVTGLAIGRNVIDAASGRARGTLEVTNYPITGPVISGPWQQPFICQTENFKLPDGTTLGPATDANCSARTVVQYVYLPTGKPANEQQPFKPLPSTTSAAGRRRENHDDQRRHGQLHRPRRDRDDESRHLPERDSARPDERSAADAVHAAEGLEPASAGASRQRLPQRLVHPGRGAWRDILDPVRLGEGYAVFINTLNHPTNSCNAFLAGETAMMGKEHFIETFGVPQFTVTSGGSGGAYTSLQIADAFPGLFDGVEIRATFPDAFAIANSGQDAHLLMHYFTATNPAGLTDAQKLAISGYEGMKALLDAANQSQRTDPVPGRQDIEGYKSAQLERGGARGNALRPDKNPKGARPTVLRRGPECLRREPGDRRGAATVGQRRRAVRPERAERRRITTAQFLDLNEQDRRLRSGCELHQRAQRRRRRARSAAPIRRV